MLYLFILDEENFPVITLMPQMLRATEGKRVREGAFLWIFFQNSLARDIGVLISRENTIFPHSIHFLGSCNYV